jgi:hypothetical protein
MMEAAGFSESSLRFCQTTQRYITQDSSNLFVLGSENLKFLGGMNFLIVARNQVLVTDETFSSKTGCENVAPRQGCR